MKATVAPYETAAWCLRIECTNGVVIRLAAYPFDLVMSNGQVYKTENGYSPSSFVSTGSLAPSALDLEGIVGVNGITRDQIASGVVDGAEVFLFRCNFLSPIEDYEEVGSCWFGKTQLVDDRYKAELMSLSDALNESATVIVTPTCRHPFGSTGYAQCGKALGPLTVTGTLTSVTSASIFRDSARSEVEDWFGAGTFRFTSGSNAGLKPIEIKAYSADGTITLHEPAYYMPTAGDAYEIIPGCRKRREDCRDKWNNIGNFGGFPDMPPESTYTDIGTNF